jgi:cytochrome c peroxidase
MRRFIGIAFPVLLVVLVLSAAWGAKKSEAPAGLSPEEREALMVEVGRLIFFDENLSAPKKMSCATCHAPEAGFTSPDAELNLEFGVYHGAIEKRFGNRKIPTSAYLLDVPELQYNELFGFWFGGLFSDGRASGWGEPPLDDPLVQQAMGPFLNPVEQNLPGARQLVLRVAQSSYAPLFRQIWGPGSLDHVRDVQGAYIRIAQTIAAYERSDEVNPFSSKYDYAQDLGSGVVLSAQEQRGLGLFQQKGCAVCHTPPLFTTFSYANLGMPRNPDNPFYQQTKKINPDGDGWVDLGLGGYLESIGAPASVYLPQYGAHKTPTLRNIDRRPNNDPSFVKAFGHNGYFKSLEAIVHFYNTRDKDGANWPPPEVDAGNIVGMPFIGDLGMSADDEADLVAFLRALTDGYQP